MLIGFAHKVYLSSEYTRVLFSQLHFYKATLKRNSYTFKEGNSVKIFYPLSEMGCKRKDFASLGVDPLLEWDRPAVGKVQQTLDYSNTGGSFILDDSNSF